MLDDIELHDLSVAKFCLVLFNKHSFGEIQILRLGMIQARPLLLRYHIIWRNNLF